MCGQKVSDICKSYFKIYLEIFRRVDVQNVQIETYFILKSNITALLMSNVVYRFSWHCDAGLTYISKSTRHMVTRS